jgi:CyaY protein
MDESTFLQQAERTLDAIETGIDASGADIECERSGNVLTLEFEDGAKIVINSQTPTRQMWVAARSGGFHYGWDGSRWIDTRSGAELFTALSLLVSQQGCQALILRA